MERHTIKILFTLLGSFVLLSNTLFTQVRIRERVEVGATQQLQGGELRYFKLARDVMVNPFIQVIRACYPIKIIATGRVESNHKDKRFLSVMLGLGYYGNLTHKTDSVIVGCCGSTYIEVWTWSGCPITITDVQVEETGINTMVFHFYGYQYCPHPVYPTFEAIVEVRAELLNPIETPVRCSMWSSSNGRLISSGTVKQDKVRAVMEKENGEGIQCCCGEVEFQLRPLITGVELRSINEQGGEERGGRVHSAYRNNEGADVWLVWDGQYRGWDSVDVEIIARGFGLEGKTKVRLVYIPEGCFFVWTEYDTVFAGGRVRLYFDRPARSYDVFLIGEEEEKGYLEAMWNYRGEALYGVNNPVYYVAPITMRGEEQVVEIWARKSDIVACDREGGNKEENGIQIETKREGRSLTKRELQPSECPRKAIVVKQMFDHFDVKIHPEGVSGSDTVAYAEGATIEVQARGKHGEALELNGDVELKIRILENSEYLCFVNSYGDTVESCELEGVTYGEARSKRIQIVAVRKNPENPVRCLLRVELAGDPRKYGECKVVVVEQSLRIEMEGPLEVRPSIPTEDKNPEKVALRRKPFEVRMTRNGKPVSNHPVRLWTDYVEGSGGHNHDDTRDVRRADNNDNYGYFTLGTSREPKRPFDGLTNSEGMMEVVYNASIFGDCMRIYVRSRDARKAKYLVDSVTIVEKVAGLINFRDRAQYCVFDQSPKGKRQHQDNSWCLPEFADSLQRAITRFYQWTLSRGRGVLLSINDMCLPYGGRFDIDGRWGGRNDQEHLYHRVGTSVDINRTLTINQLRQLEEIMRHYGLRRHPERPQIHFGFWNSW